MAGRGRETKMVWMLPVDLRLVGSFTRLFITEWMCQTATTTMEFWQWHDGGKWGSQKILETTTMKISNLFPRLRQITWRGLRIFFFTVTFPAHKSRHQNEQQAGEDGCDDDFHYSTWRKESFRPNREKERKKIICRNKRRTNGANKILNGTLGSAEWWWQQRWDENGRRS